MKTKKNAGGFNKVEPRKTKAIILLFLIKRLFICRIEEIPTIARFIIDSLTADLADFAAFSPHFDADYIQQFEDKRTEVVNLLNPKNITRAKKKITKRILRNMRGMRPFLTKLQGYVRLAFNTAGTVLTVDPSDFGIKELRKAIRNGDVEEMDLAFRTLRKNITDNYAALLAAGYTDAQRNDFYALYDAVMADNALQNVKDREREEEVEANMEKFNKMWTDFILDTCDIGKRIYADTHPAHVQEYTMDTLINRIRQELPKERFHAVTFNADETRVLKNVVDGTIGVNTGETNLEVRAGGNDAEGVFELWAAGTQKLINTIDGKITVHNKSIDEEGKCKVKAIGSVV